MSSEKGSLDAAEVAAATARFRQRFDKATEIEAAWRAGVVAGYEAGRLHPSEGHASRPHATHLCYCGEEWSAAESSLDAARLRSALAEAIEAAHQTGSIRDHVDTTDKTGWHVRGIETCADLLCVEALAALRGDAT